MWISPKEREREDIRLKNPKKRPKKGVNPKGTCKIHVEGLKTCQTHLRHEKTHENTFHRMGKAQNRPKEVKNPKTQQNACKKQSNGTDSPQTVSRHFRGPKTRENTNKCGAGAVEGREEGCGRERASSGGTGGENLLL